MIHQYQPIFRVLHTATKTNMKSIVILALLVAVALAAPPQNPNEVAVVRSSNENNINGYGYGYELSDGTKVDETGELKNAGSENEAISVRGSFSFVGLDGVTYTIQYIADENGFQPQGAHIPVAP